MYTRSSCSDYGQLLYTSCNVLAILCMGCDEVHVLAEPREDPGACVYMYTITSSMVSYDETIYEVIVYIYICSFVASSHAFHKSLFVIAVPALASAFF